MSEPRPPAAHDAPLVARSSSSAPTHAGAVVWRAGAEGPLFLLVTAKGAPDEWVLPKGHIESGESPGQTARREVHEETGLDVEVADYLGTEAFVAKGARVVCAYYLASWSPAEAPSPVARASRDATSEPDSPTRPASRPAQPGDHGATAPLPAAEGRRMVWLQIGNAIDKATFPAGRAMLRSARDRLGVGPR